MSRPRKGREMLGDGFGSSYSAKVVRKMGFEESLKEYPALPMSTPRLTRCHYGRETGGRIERQLSFRSSLPSILLLDRPRRPKQRGTGDPGVESGVRGRVTEGELEAIDSWETRFLGRVVSSSLSPSRERFLDF